MNVRFEFRMYLLVLRHIRVELHLLVDLILWIGLTVVVCIIMQDLGEANPLVGLVHVLIVYGG